MVRELEPALEAARAALAAFVGADPTTSSSCPTPPPA
jgi:hypothetical protein